MSKVFLITGTRHPLTEQHEGIVRDKILSYCGASAYTLIHGDCSGVDKYGAEVAKSLGWNIIAVPAQWNKHGRNAGPIRNQHMLNTYRPYIVLAFPSLIPKAHTIASIGLKPMVPVTVVG